MNEAGPSSDATTRARLRRLQGPSSLVGRSAVRPASEADRLTVLAVVRRGQVPVVEPVDQLRSPNSGLVCGSTSTSL